MGRGEDHLPRSLRRLHRENPRQFSAENRSYLQKYRTRRRAGPGRLTQPPENAQKRRPVAPTHPVSFSPTPPTPTPAPSSSSPTTLAWPPVSIALELRRSRLLTSSHPSPATPTTLPPPTPTTLGSYLGAGPVPPSAVLDENPEFSVNTLILRKFAENPADHTRKSPPPKKRAFLLRTRYAVTTRRGFSRTAAEEGKAMSAQRSDLREHSSTAVLTKDPVRLKPRPLSSLPQSRVPPAHPREHR